MLTPLEEVEILLNQIKLEVKQKRRSYTIYDNSDNRFWSTGLKEANLEYFQACNILKYLGYIVSSEITFYHRHSNEYVTIIEW